MGVEIKIIVVVILVIAVSVIMLMIIRALAKQADKSMHDSVVTQINTYDSIIEEKNIRLAAVNARISEADKILREKLKEEEHNGEHIILPAGIVETAFCRDDFITDYKNIKEHFHFNKSLLYDVISSISRNNESIKLFQITNGILEKLNINLIYSIGTFKPEEQKEILLEIFDDEEKQFFSEYVSRVRTFKCEKFWYYLKSIRNRNDSTIRVNTSDDSATLMEEYVREKLPEGYSVRITHDDGLCDGFQVLSSRKLYDYGIRRNELS